MMLLAVPPNVDRAIYDAQLLWFEAHGQPMDVKAETLISIDDQGVVTVEGLVQKQAVWDTTPPDRRLGDLRSSTR